MPRVVGIGQCALDTLLRVPEYPPADTKCEYLERVVCGGGPTATALVALARWGAACRFAGMVGDDPAGRDITASLREDGVEVADLRVREGATSQLATIVVEAGTGRRTVFWKRPSAAPLRTDEIPLDAVAAADLVYLDGLFPEASLAAAHAARKAGVPVVVDAGTLREGMLDLARVSTCFIVAERFAEAFGPGESPEVVSRRLAELGPTLTGVTLGDRGYVALDRGRGIRGPARPARVVDTTGCGDVFHAGVAHGIVSGWNPERSLDFGAWAAAGAAGALGGRAGIPEASGYPGNP